MSREGTHSFSREAHTSRLRVDGKADQQKEHRQVGLQPLGEAFLALLERDQRRLLRLCATLESAADRLPASRHQVKKPRMLTFLNGAFARHVFLHEKCLFPLMRSLASQKAFIEPILSQLEFEHASDHGLVLEITSSLVNGGPGNLADAHAFGYLLRCFFENCRRHQHWERCVLYPIARRHLTGGSVAEQHEALLRMSLGPCC